MDVEALVKEPSQQRLSPVANRKVARDAIRVRPCYRTVAAVLRDAVDHRVMDGERANRFLNVLVDRLEGWRDE